MASVSAAKKSENSMSKYVQQSLDSLNAEYPNWQNSQGNEATICIPEYFETVRRNLENATSAIDQSGNRGDITEQKVFDALKTLKIGAILISNFDMDEFGKRAGVVAKQYKAAVVDYNNTASASGNASIKENFECDFLLFHQQIGIYIIEVKAVEHEIPEKALQQVTALPLKIELLFKAINNGNLCDAPIRAAVCCPNSSISNVIHSAGLSFDVLDMDNFDPNELNDVELLFSQADSDDYNEGGENKIFRQFWLELINDSDKNLFAKQSFQHFIAVLSCFRSTVYLKGVLNAVHVAKLIQKQQLNPKAKKAKSSQDPARRELHISSIAAADDVLFLTKEQQAVDTCSDARQLIFGSPGTGKTLLLQLKALKASFLLLL